MKKRKEERIAQEVMLDVRLMTEVPASSPSHVPRARGLHGDESVLGTGGRYARGSEKPTTTILPFILRSIMQYSLPAEGSFPLPPPIIPPV
jgi:hypothetical protein